MTLENALERIAGLEKENVDLKERLLKVENAYKRKSEAEWRLNDLYQRLLTDYANAEKCSREYFARYRTMVDRCLNAEMIIGNLYAICKDNHYPNSSVQMEQAEQFLKEVKQ